MIESKRKKKPKDDYPKEKDTAKRLSAEAWLKSPLRKRLLEKCDDIEKIFNEAKEKRE